MSEGQLISIVEWIWHVTDPKSLILPIHQYFETCHIAFSPLSEVQDGKPFTSFWALLNVIARLEWKFWTKPWRLKESEVQQPDSKFLRCLGNPGIAVVLSGSRVPSKMESYIFMQHNFPIWAIWLANIKINSSSTQSKCFDLGNFFWGISKSW